MTDSPTTAQRWLAELCDAMSSDAEYELPTYHENGAVRRSVERWAAQHDILKSHTFCENCGCTWLDNGINPLGCPYCKKALRDAAKAGGPR